MKQKTYKTTVADITVRDGITFISSSALIDFDQSLSELIGKIDNGGLYIPAFHLARQHRSMIDLIDPIHQLDKQDGDFLKESLSSYDAWFAGLTQFVVTTTSSFDEQVYFTATHLAFPSIRLGNGIQRLIQMTRSLCKLKKDQTLIIDLPEFGLESYPLYYWAGWFYEQAIKRGVNLIIKTNEITVLDAALVHSPFLATYGFDFDGSVTQKHYDDPDVLRALREERGIDVFRN